MPWARGATAAGISGRSVHALRYSIAVHLLDAGPGIEYVVHHLGHRNIQNTRVYAQILTEAGGDRVIAEPKKDFDLTAH